EVRLDTTSRSRVTQCRDEYPREVTPTLERGAGVAVCRGKHLNHERRCVTHEGEHPLYAVQLVDAVEERVDLWLLEVPVEVVGELVGLRASEHPATECGQVARGVLEGSSATLDAHAFRQVGEYPVRRLLIGNALVGRLRLELHRRLVWQVRETRLLRFLDCRERAGLLLARLATDAPRSAYEPSLDEFPFRRDLADHDAACVAFDLTQRNLVYLNTVALHQVERRFLNLLHAPQPFVLLRREAVDEPAALLLNLVDAVTLEWAILDAPSGIELAEQVSLRTDLP